MILAASSVFASAPETLAVPQKPAALLARVVDSETPESRRALASKLAGKHELDVWLAAMREFGDFEAVDAGTQHYEPTLRVLGKKTSIKLFVYVPESYSPETPAPLLLVAHGTGGTGNQQHKSWKSAADKLGMLVLCPSATGANLGYTFTPEERAETMAALRWARRKFNVDENKIFLSGISRGGHLTWDVSVRHPDRFAALAPMIGGPRLSNSRGENSLRYVENVAHVPIRDLQGSRDDAHLLFNLRLAFERLEEYGAPDAELIEFPSLGHSYDFQAVNWEEFLGSCERTSTPERVVRRAARLDEARAYWLEVTAFPKKIEEGFQLRVSAKKWRAMSDEEQRKTMQKAADDRTARIEMHMLGVGSFEGEGNDIKGFRILLTREMFESKKPVSVRFNRRSKKIRVKESSEVLLRDFAERFDRTFLPVAEAHFKN